MAKIIVRNNQSRIHQIGMPGGVGVPPVTLLPGINEVEEDQWAKCMEIPMIRDFYTKPRKDDDGDPLKPLLEVLSAKASADPFKDARPGDAIKMIGELLDVKRLRELAETETRPAVQQAIQKQLAKINAAGAEPSAAK